MARRRPRTPTRRPGLGHAFVKRTLDVTVSGLALVVLSVPLALIAFAVFLTDPRANVIYRQRRCGRAGRSFDVLKFRTMVADADARKESLRELSTVAWPDFRLANDPRVTGLGRWLRRTSLDELPQLVNVLRGEMSLVGPRPTSFAVSTYELWQTERLEFRPGLTGPWQVWGRTSMDFPQRCRLEISFFRTPSLRSELRILAATVGVVIRRTGVG